MSRAILSRAALFVAALLPASAAAQDKWPSKPINMSSRFAAGGNADVLARIVGEKAAKALGPAVHLSRTVRGPAATLGLDAIAKANPDGYTLGIGTTGPLTINPHLLKEKMPFDARKDIKPLMVMATQPNLIVVTTHCQSNDGRVDRLPEGQPGQGELCQFGHRHLAAFVHGDSWCSKPGSRLRTFPIAPPIRSCRT